MSIDDQNRMAGAICWSCPKTPTAASTAATDSMTAKAFRVLPKHRERM